MQPAWTTDRDRIFFTQLSTVNESYISVYGRTGSDIPSVIGKWYKVFPNDPCQGFILVFTDGEPEGDAKELDQQLLSSVEIFAAARQPLTTFLIAVGDDREAMRIPEHDNEGNFVGFAAEENGDYIFSRPNIGYLEDIAGRFRAKLIFRYDRGENLMPRVAEAIRDARKVAAVHKKERYESIVPWFAAGFLGSFVLLLWTLPKL